MSYCPGSLASPQQTLGLKREAQRDELLSRVTGESTADPQTESSAPTPVFSLPVLHSFHPLPFPCQQPV